MHRSTRSGRFALGVLLAALLGGCDSTQNVTEPHSNPTQDFIAFESSVTSQARKSGIDLTAAPADAPIQRSIGSFGYTYVRGRAGDTSVSAVIGQDGGVLNLGNHWLLVPRGAVAADTRFRMTPMRDGTMHVDLTATTVRRIEVENDAGQAGFLKPVYLAFNLADAAQPVDPSRLGVAWRVVGDLIVMQESFIYDNAWAVGVLRHFSGYVLVGN